MNRWLVLALLLTGLTLAGTLLVFLLFDDRLPQTIAVHWDLYGDPDQFVSRQDALGYFLITPALMGVVILIWLALPWLSPKKFEVDSFRNTFNYVMALVVMLSGYLQLVMIWNTLDANIAFLQWFLGGMFLFLAMIGNVLGKVRRNFWMGVRTPWTLASEIVWNQTHRLTAWLFVGYGLTAFVAVLAGVDAIWCAAGLGVIVLYPVLYSLWLYKRLEKQGKLDG